MSVGRKYMHNIENISEKYFRLAQTIATDYKIPLSPGLICFLDAYLTYKNADACENVIHTQNRFSDKLNFILGLQVATKSKSDEAILLLEGERQNMANLSFSLIAKHLVTWETGRESTLTPGNAAFLAGIKHYSGIDSPRNYDAAIENFQKYLDNPASRIPINRFNADILILMSYHQKILLVENKKISEKSAIVEKAMSIFERMLMHRDDYILVPAFHVEAIILLAEFANKTTSYKDHSAIIKQFIHYYKYLLILSSQHDKNVAVVQDNLSSKSLDKIYNLISFMFETIKNSTLFININNWNFTIYTLSTIVDDTNDNALRLVYLKVLSNLADFASDIKTDKNDNKLDKTVAYRLRRTAARLCVKHYESLDREEIEFAMHNVDQMHKLVPSADKCDPNDNDIAKIYAELTEYRVVYGIALAALTRAAATVSIIPYNLHNVTTIYTPPALTTIGDRKYSKS